MMEPAPEPAVGVKKAAAPLSACADDIEASQCMRLAKTRHREQFSQTVAQFLRSKMSEGHAELLAATGEVNEISRDADLAHGESSLTFKDVSFSSKQRSGKETFILAPVSGHFEPGTLVALMGPSGAGKTLLLDILAGKKAPPYGGTIHMNGRPRDSLYVRMTAYVSGQELMPAHMTVEETISFVHALKNQLPTKVSREMRSELVTGILEGLGLSQVRDTWIGDENVRGISGGERRRVGIARGLAAGAQIIFCDEATSGLSATDAERCVRYMRFIAHKFGMIILAAIHQPRIEVSRLFDHLLLLTSGPGRVVYNGPMAEAPAHWAVAGFRVPQRVNPTDFFLDLATPGTARSQVDTLVAQYDRYCRPLLDELVKRELNRLKKTNAELLEARRQQLLRFGRVPKATTSRYAVPLATQLSLVIGRQLKLHLRDKQGLTTDLAIPVVKALVVGIAYLNIGKKTSGITAAFQQMYFLFMVLMTCALDGMKVMPKLIGDRVIMKAETISALYAQWAYIMCFSIISSVQAIISQCIFFFVLTLLTGIPWSLCPAIFLWTTMLYFSFDSLYLLVAAIAKDETNAQILALPIVVLFLLFNGLTVNKVTTPVYLSWALEMSPVAHAMQATAVAAADHYGGDGWQMVMEKFGYRKDVEGDVSVFVVCIGTMRILQVILLRVCNNRNR